MKNEVRISPHCEDSEKAVLGNLISNSKIHDEIAPFLDSVFNKFIEEFPDDNII